MYLPLFFKPKELSILIVGGGKVSARKLPMLLPAARALTVIAPAIDDRIREAVDSGLVIWQPRKFEPGDCRGFHLVVAATPCEEVNRAVSCEARTLEIPVNVVDRPELCTVVFGAVWQAGRLTVSVCTGGTAPFMASAIRDRIATEAGGWGEWVDAAGRFRAAVRSAVDNPSERERLYRRFTTCFHSAPPEIFPQGHDLADWIEWLKLSDLDEPK